MGYGLTLSRIVSIIRFRIRRRLQCKTEEDIQEAWAPKCFKYAIRVPGDMLILTITFSYAVIAPLILVFAILYFGLGWLFMRNLVRPLCTLCIQVINFLKLMSHKCRLYVLNALHLPIWSLYHMDLRD